MSPSGRVKKSILDKIRGDSPQMISEKDNMGDIIIKKENGKEVVYRTGNPFGDIKIGELHEKWDGSKETRNIIGENVKVDRKGEFSNSRKAEVDGGVRSF